MGYAMSQSAIDAFRAMNHQSATIAVTPVTGSAFTITEADIRQGGMTIDRFSASGETVELGSCVAAELALTLDNTSGRFDAVVFEGAQMVVTVSCSDGVNTYSVPMGYFTVDEAPKIRNIISLVALDRMVQFDRDVDLAALALPMTVQALVTRLCADCGIVISSTVDMTAMPNHGVTINELADGGYTYRQLLSWCCQMLGVCAYMDWNGELRLEWYHMSDAESDAADILPSRRFSSDYEESPVALSGVLYAAPDGTEYLSGVDEYALDISANVLAGNAPSAVVGGIAGVVVGMTYNPFSAVVVPMPWIWPLDKVWFYPAADGQSGLEAYITNVTFTLNGRMSLVSKGESATRKGYASANPLTNREQVVIRAIEQSQSQKLDAKALSILQFNDLITNALGLYSTTVPQSGGGNVYYMHNEPQLEDSMVIFTGTASGIAWTDSGWNGGDPVWQYGVTSAGAAFFDTLAANRVNADWVQTGVLQSADGTTFYLDLDNGVLNMDVTSLKLEGESMSVLLQGVAEDAADAAQVVQDDLDALKAHIVIGNDGSMTFIGAQGNPITLRLTNDSVQILNSGSVIDTFGSGGTETENLTILSGGSLTMDPYKWVSRSNGHLQLVYVG